MKPAGFKNLKLSAISAMTLLIAAAAPYASHGFSSERATFVSNNQASHILRNLSRSKMIFMRTHNEKKLADPSYASSSEAEINSALIVSIYDRLIFALNSRYRAGDVHEFLADYCITLAEIEHRRKSPLVQFYAYLSDVIKVSHEERENLALVIEKYIHTAPVSEPMPAARFILDNSYSNGSMSERAHGADRNELGAQESELTVEKVSDFEFSSEVEDWFSRQDPVPAPEPVPAAPDAPTAPEGTDLQTSEPGSPQTPKSESSTPPLGNAAPSGTPSSNIEIAPPPPPGEYSQTTTASASEPKSETAETK